MTLSDDEIVDMLIERAEAQGKDMTLMRASQASLRAMPVGDPTPPSGSLLVEPPTLVVPQPPMHHGLYDTAEGPFFVPLEMSDEPAKPRWANQLTKKVKRNQTSLALLWLCFISVVVDIALHW